LGRGRNEIFKGSRSFLGRIQGCIFKKDRGKEEAKSLLSWLHAAWCCAELSIVVAVVEQIYFLQFCGTSLVFGGKMKKKRWNMNYKAVLF